MLAVIKKEKDFEIRADLYGESLLLQPKGLQLCYDAALTIQTLVPQGTSCGKEQGFLMKHFPHPALTSGRRG